MAPSGNRFEDSRWEINKQFMSKSILKLICERHILTSAFRLCSLESRKHLNRLQAQPSPQNFGDLSSVSTRKEDLEFYPTMSLDLQPRHRLDLALETQLEWDFLA